MGRGALGLRVCFIIKAINERTRGQMARLVSAPAPVLPGTPAKRIPARKRRSPPNVSGFAKLERGRKIEVTLIDYLGLGYYGCGVTGRTGTTDYVGLNEVSDYAPVTAGSWESK